MGSNIGIFNSTKVYSFFHQKTRPDCCFVQQFDASFLNKQIQQITTKEINKITEINVVAHQQKNNLIETGILARENQFTKQSPVILNRTNEKKLVEKKSNRFTII